jgi:DNA-binding NtrC family response regulator
LILLHVADAADGQAVAGLIKQAVALGKPIATLVLADHYCPTEALEVLRLGAADYLSRPLDLPRLTYLIDVLTVRFRFAQAKAAPAADIVGLGEQDAFLYCPSTDFGLVMDQIRRVAPQDSTVLLGGETGTGKTRLARLIHDLSPRRAEPFLVVNCAALSESLSESELFGHTRGAFTGADRDRTGKFAEAADGTLLLDDIDALPATLQAKILRVVEDRVFETLGSNKPVQMRARLVVASNRCLDAEVAAGRFRADLYYRLNVVAFFLPPLRECSPVIPALAEKFLKEFATRTNRPVPGLAADARRALEAHTWPGNVRELRNAIERAVTLCAGPEICLADLPVALHAQAVAAAATAVAPAPNFAGSPADNDSRGTLAQTKEVAEAQRILEALKRHKNNRLRAAADLGISRMTLYKKLHRYGLMPAC